MKEAIGNAFVLSIFAIFGFLIIVILTSSISFSRASKIKNRLLTFVENKAENNPDFSKEMFDSDDFQSEVNTLLKDAGYRQKDSINQYETTCPEIADAILMDNYNTPYDYCIYATSTSRGYFYTVVTYMYFDIPVIGKSLKFPVKGSTRVIYSLDGR